MPVDLTPTEQIATAAKKGLVLLEAGRAGDGLKDQTINDARRMAAQKLLSADKVRAMPAWFARHNSDRKPGWDKAGEETPGYVAFLLWGGETAADWASRKVAQLDKENQKSLQEVGNMADNEQVMPEPGEGTPEEEIVDLADCIEELSEALADLINFKMRAHGHHWNVKGPAFGAYHELFRTIYQSADENIDGLAEQLLKLDTDAPNNLAEVVERATIKCQPLNSDDPQVLATDLRDHNDMLLVSLEDAYDCANELDEAIGTANFLAEVIDDQRKWRWQLTRSISNAAEAPVVAPMNPDESTEVEEEDYGMVEMERSFVGEVELRNQPELLAEIREGSTVVEQRHAPCTMEVRAQEDGSWTLTGLAAVFDSPSQDLGGFTEVIKRGAFKEVLNSPGLDVRVLFNHSQDMPLARSTNGSLQLEETPRGLKYTAQVPAGLSYGDDLRKLLESGIVTQSSFAFRMPPKGDGQTWEEQGDGMLLRTITKFGGLVDVSPVTTPAYTSATAGVGNSSSSRSEEQGTQASGVEQGEQASDMARRVEAERAQKEREIRLRERKLAQSK